MDGEKDERDLYDDEERKDVGEDNPEPVLPIEDIKDVHPDTINQWIRCNEEAGKILWVETGLWVKCCRLYARSWIVDLGIDPGRAYELAEDAFLKSYMRFKEHPERYHYTNVLQWLKTLFLSLKGMCSNLARERREYEYKSVSLDEQLEKEDCFKATKEALLKKKSCQNDPWRKELLVMICNQFSSRLSGKIKEYFSYVCEFYGGGNWIDFFYEKKEHNNYLKKHMQARGIPESAFYTRNLRLRDAFKKFFVNFMDTEEGKKLIYNLKNEAAPPE